MSLCPLLNSVDEKSCLRLFLNHLEMIDNKEFMLVEILHDEIGSDLMACKMQLAHLDIGKSEKNILESQLNAILNKIRELSNQIYPSSIEKLGLIVALKMSLRQLQESSKIKIELKANTDSTSLSQTEERAFFFILNELISNCIKHANCECISLEILETAETFSCKIVDDGDGFQITEADFFDPCQMGLQKVFGRIKGMNAEIEFIKNDVKGSTVNIMLKYAN